MFDDGWDFGLWDIEADDGRSHAAPERCRMWTSVRIRDESAEPGGCDSLSSD